MSICSFYRCKEEATEAIKPILISSIEEEGKIWSQRDGVGEYTKLCKKHGSQFVDGLSKGGMEFFFIEKSDPNRMGRDFDEYIASINHESS